MTVIYAEGVSNISAHEGVVRIELSASDPTDQDKTKRAGQIVMSIAGLVRMHEMLTNAIDGMVDKGILQKK